LPRGKSEVKSSPRFGNQMADFNASKTLSERHDGLGLVMQIRPRTRKESSPPEQILNEIKAEIDLPERQHVVFATAPTGNRESISVVQVTECAKARETKNNR
jgi:hypothetical protein